MHSKCMCVCAHVCVYVNIYIYVHKPEVSGAVAYNKKNILDMRLSLGHIKQITDNRQQLHPACGPDSTAWNQASQAGIKSLSGPKQLRSIPTALKARTNPQETEEAALK